MSTRRCTCDRAFNRRAVSPTASQTLQSSAASQHGVSEGGTEASADNEILQTDDSGADRVTS